MSDKQIIRASIRVDYEDGTSETIVTNTETTSVELIVATLSSFWSFQINVQEKVKDGSYAWLMTQRKHLGQVYESRPECPASAHDTASARDRKGCKCPKAVRDYKANKRAYYRRNIAKLREQARSKYEKTPRTGGSPSTGPTYRDPRPLSDNFIVESLLLGHPMPSAMRYDRWHAALILMQKNNLTNGGIGRRTGMSRRSVVRLKKWFRENDLLDS